MSVKSAEQNSQVSENKAGWLLKWTNYMKGFQKRYVVLQDGVLSYYRDPQEMQHTCRGTLVLSNASIEIESGNNFIVYAGSKKSGQCFYLRAEDIKDRTEWILAIEMAKAHMRSRSESLKSNQQDVNSCVSLDLDDEDDSDDELQWSEDELGDPNSSSPTTRPSTKAFNKRFHEVQQDQTNLFEKLQQLSIHVNQDAELAGNPELMSRVSEVESASSTLLTQVGDFMNDVTRFQRGWQRLLSLSEEKRKQLEESLEALAKQHRRLEISASKVNRHTHHEDDFKITSDEEFYDAVSTDEEDEDQEDNLFRDAETVDVVSPAEASRQLTVKKMDGFTYRMSIPFKPDHRVSLWSIMKNCIGKDLSKIPMPVNFNEPISLTQRLVEDLEYSHLLDDAAKAQGAERLMYIGAYTVTPFGCCPQRVAKPFNPMLGETFEMDRRADLGWRVIVEQVSHHPPIACMHAEGEGWEFWQEFSMASKFRGKYLELVPTGISHCIFKDTGDHYYWTKTPTTVHNIIVGKLWLDQHGSMTIKNLRDGMTCDIKYIPYSYFDRGETRRVVGQVKDENGAVVWEINGSWDRYLNANPSQQPEQSKAVWKRNPNVMNFDKMYGFSLLTMQLNQFSPLDENCAITDSRYRPDKNLMENANFDMANRVKHLLEEAQRHRRRQYEQTRTTWTPRWFTKKPDPAVPSRLVHQYEGKYWSAKEDGSLRTMDIVDVYDMSPVKSKDIEAFNVGDKAKLVNFNQNSTA